MTQKNWSEYVASDEGIDMGTGHVLDNTNWPALYEAKLLVQRLAAANQMLTGEQQAQIEETAHQLATATALAEQWKAAVRLSGREAAGQSEGQNA